MLTHMLGGGEPRPSGSGQTVAGHWLSLFFQNVSYRGVDILPGPEMPRAPVPRPTEAAPFLGIREIQRPAGIGLEGVHDKFGRNVRIDPGVHMVRTHLHGEQTPVFVLADLTDRVTSNSALIDIHLEGRLL